MRLIGLTGRSGCGKTTVGQIARSMGIPVLDCDEIYREMTSSPSPCLHAIANAFGDETVRDGALYRPALRQKVFFDPNALQELNSITAQYMRPEIDSRIAEIDASIVLLDAPTLFQSGLDTACDLILCVIASDEVCIERIMKRDNIDDVSAKNRLENQYSNEFFIEHCDLVIYNENDRDVLCKDVYAVLHTLLENKEV